MTSSCESPFVCIPSVMKPHTRQNKEKYRCKLAQKHRMKFVMSPQWYLRNISSSKDYQYGHRVASGQGKVSEKKKISRSMKSWWILWEVSEKLDLTRSQWIWNCLGLATLGHPGPTLARHWINRVIDPTGPTTSALRWPDKYTTWGTFY